MWIFAREDIAIKMQTFLFHFLECVLINSVIKAMGLHHWQCRASGDNDNLCTKRKQSGKDSVIKAQPLLLFM
jgi:hypothetical protein